MSKNYPLALGFKDNIDYKSPKHLLLLNLKLIEASKEKKRIIVSLPPRHGKSNLISQYFPAWYLMNYPNNRLMLITSSNSSAQNYGRKIRDLIKNYGIYYDSKVVLNQSSKSVSEFAFENYRGEFYAVGAGAENIVGKGANFMIIDDPISDLSKVINPLQRDKLFEWFQSDIFNRLEPNGSIFLVMQRWHIDDIAARLIKSDINWEYIEIPAIANDNDILGREKGQPLWSKRYDLDSLNEIRLQMGDYWFNAKYQQRPMTSDSSIFKNENIQFYDNVNDFDFVYLSYDTAFKTGNLNDFTACVVFGFKNDKIYIINSYQKKLQYPELKLQVESDYKRYKPQAVLIEDKASGQSLIQDLKRNTNISIKPIKVDSDKMLRANIASMYMYKVYFSENNMELINQLVTFPYDVHDDMVDAFTQGVNFLKKMSSTPNVLTL